MTINNTRPGWPLSVALIALILLLTMIFYHQTVVYLGSKWNEISVGEYAHGYLVLAISVYLIIRSRKKLAKLIPCPTYVAFLFLVPAAVLWLLAVLVDVEMLQTIALLGVLFSLTWALVGHQAMKILAFPILFIGFAIPVWFPLSPLLQNITADVVFWIMRLIEVPAFRQENMISVPSGQFSIEEACSGLRYLLAALTLGSLYAYLNYKTLTGRVAVILIAAGAALLSNIIRVFIVIYLGYATEMQHPWVGDHLMMGWYLFGGLVVVLLFVDARFYRHGSVAEDVTGDVAAEEESPCVNDSCQKSRIQYFIIATLCAIVLSIGPLIVIQKNSQQQLSSTDIEIVLPEDIGGWSRPMVSANDWMPQYHGAVSVKSDYRVRGEDVTLFVAYYPDQKQGTEVINDLNRINNKVWRTKYSHARVEHLQVHDVMEQVLENNQGDKILVWYWYNVGGKVTINKYEAKLLQLANMLLGQTEAYMVAVSITINDDVESPRQFMSKIIDDLNKPLENMKITYKN